MIVREQLRDSYPLPRFSRMFQKAGGMLRVGMVAKETRKRSRLAVLGDADARVAVLCCTLLLRTAISYGTALLEH
jgi:hypothetical protein